MSSKEIMADAAATVAAASAAASAAHSAAAAATQQQVAREHAREQQLLAAQEASLAESTENIMRALDLPHGEPMSLNNGSNAPVESTEDFMEQVMAVAGEDWAMTTDEEAATARADLAELMAEIS